MVNSHRSATMIVMVARSEHDLHVVALHGIEGGQVLIGRQQCELREQAGTHGARLEPSARYAVAIVHGCSLVI